MARTWLRGVAWAIIWFSIPTSVGANGRVDDARQLFLSDITDAYNESVEYLEANNTTAGAEALQRLLELVSRLDRLWDGFGNDAKALLSASLFEEWGNVYNEIDQLYTETLNLKDKVGREQFSSDNLETRYDRTGSALEEFNEGMQEFGKKLGAMMSGPVENAHQLYANAITDAYEDTVDYLEANNTNDGAGAAGNLHQLANKLGELAYLIEQESNALSPSLVKIWSETIPRIREFAVTAGVLKMQVGVSSFTLDDLERTFENAGSELEESYASMEDFVERFAAMCDTCT
jgi:hypothetical protein